MTKRKSSSRDGLFFLLGAIVYSLLFWLLGKNHAHAYGAIQVSLLAYLIYKLTCHHSKTEFIKPRDVIYMCVGIVLDSFYGGFPFNILSR